MDPNKFKVDVKRQLAQRAGYMCSLCGKLTVGPSEEGDEKVNLTGEAAHISSAKKGGKRYRTMKSTKRRDITNGIWLCSSHHDLVDGDECEYTIDFLETVKTNHEARVKLMNSGLRLDKGLIVQVKIENMGKFKTKTEIDFGNSTLIFGDNATGKTLICDTLCSISDVAYVKKWALRKRDSSSNYTVSYYDSTVSKFRINYSSNNDIAYIFNEEEVPTFISPYHCFNIEDDFFEVREKTHRITLQLANYFKIEENQFITLVNFTNKFEKQFINEIYFNENNELQVKVSLNRHTLKFEALSSGEKYRVILELALRLAKYYSRYKPTLFILDYHAIASIDSSGINNLLDYIVNDKPKFQFIFTSHMPYDHYKVSPHHKTYRIVEGKNGSSIIQLK